MSILSVPVLIFSIAELVLSISMVIHLRVCHRSAIAINRSCIARQRLNLSSWNNLQGMAFANNAVYTKLGSALRFPHGAKGVDVSGNVLVGKVSRVGQGFVVGNDLTDFARVSWDGEHRDATPTKNSSLIGTADAKYSVPVDIRGDERGRGATARAFRVP